MDSCAGPRFVAHARDRSRDDLRGAHRLRALLLLAIAGAACGSDGATTGGETSATTGADETTAGATSAGPTTMATSSQPESSTSIDPSTDGSTTETEPTWEVAFEADESIGALFSVWGPSADHVYVVGGQQGEGGFSAGAMLVRSAGEWAAASLPESTPKLNWIHGVDTLRIAVGERGAILMREGDDDATAWTAMGCSTVLSLWGAWAVAPDDVWVVGGDGFDRPPVLCHFDGAEWTNLELPPIDVDAKALFKVFAIASDDVWAVGDVGLVIHYDGEAWAQVPIDTPADMISLWGIGPGELLAVGGRGSGVLARYDGAAWTVATLETPGLNGVWMDSDGASHAVGINGTLLGVGAASLDPQIVPPPTLLTLHAVWSPGDGTFLAVGGNLELPPPWVGVIVERN